MANIALNARDHDGQKRDSNYWAMFVLTAHDSFVLRWAYTGISKKSTNDATIWGFAEPEPDWPFSVTKGTKDVWFLSVKNAEKPEGLNVEGDTLISAAEI